MLIDCFGGIMGQKKGGGEMKDFPCFATDDGVASLILKEIPYSQEA